MNIPHPDYLHPLHHDLANGDAKWCSGVLAPRMGNFPGIGYDDHRSFRSPAHPGAKKAGPCRAKRGEGAARAAASAS
ncbi:MAG: hypothetical protein CVT73_05205 [Alphaproteobacteria bacterium HGW-Alphaproteobacteria-12]|nr:MAG: hypothetical protein CVT73_05205 [Alphaproteobacteria bacterium HGW-Alphaproteobacteria-12]